MLPSGLQNLIENLVESVNFAHDISLPLEAQNSTYWLNDVIVESWRVIAKKHENHALDYLIRYIVERDGIQLNVLFNILRIMIDEEIFCRKKIATILVGSETLKVTNEDFFRRCYNFLNNLLKSLDYKTNREVFNKSIEKTHTFPQISSIREKRLVYYCLQVIKRLMERENNYMPAYFAMHELLKCYSPAAGETDKKPHPLLERDIVKFMSSFRKPAKLLIPFCRNYFVPVAGITHPSNGTFRLDAHKKLMYISINRGAVYYSDNIMRSQIEECTRLLIQTRSTDLAVGLYEIPREGEKSTGLESAFAQLLYDVMVMIESLDNPEDHRQWIMGLIEHLVCSVLYFLHSMIVGFSGIFTELNSKVIKKSWVKCRKYIWWFMVNTTSGFINKNMLEDFVPCLKFFDLLYPTSEEEWSNEVRHALYQFMGDKNSNQSDPLPQFLSTGPLVLWMHLLSKSRQLAAVPLPRQMPPPLQPLNEAVTTEARRLSNPDCALPNPTQHSAWNILMLTLNTFSTNNETTQLISRLIESLWGVKAPNSSENKSTDLSVFVLPYGIRGNGKPTLLPMSSIEVMSIHVKFLLNHLLMHSLFSEMQNVNHVSPQVVESFCRLILHREIDSQHLLKFLDGFFLPKGLSLISNQSNEGQQSQLNSPSLLTKFSDKRLFYTMLDLLIHRLSHYLTPEASVILTTIISTRLSVLMSSDQQYIPLQIQYFIDYSLLHMTRLFQKPDLSLYGLGSSSGKNYQKGAISVAIAKFSGETEEYNKMVLMSLVQLYKAYEMDEVASWNGLLQDTARQIQQRLNNSGNTGGAGSVQSSGTGTTGNQQQNPLPVPIRINQLQARELTDGLLKLFHGSVVVNWSELHPGGSLELASSGAASIGVPEATGEMCICQTGFGTFRFSTATLKKSEDIIVQMESQLEGHNTGIQNIRPDIFLTSSSYLFHCLILRIILDNFPLSSQFHVYVDQLPRRLFDQSLRQLCDYVMANIILGFRPSNIDFNVKFYPMDKIVDGLEKLILELKIIPFDRFLIFLLNRSLSGDSWRILFHLINDLFQRCISIRDCVQLLINEYRPGNNDVSMNGNLNAVRNNSNVNSNSNNNNNGNNGNNVGNNVGSNSINNSVNNDANNAFYTASSAAGGGGSGQCLGNPCHHDNWHSIHLSLHEKLSEVFVNSSNNTQLVLPQYYNHLILRLIPICEIIIGMLVHVPQAVSSMNHFFDVISKLFRFHSYPLYFSYVLIRSQNQSTPEIKRLLRKLVFHILYEHQITDRYISERGWKILAKPSESEIDHDRGTVEMCQQIMDRIYCVISSQGRAGVPLRNWRFDESTSGYSHVLYSSAIEIILCVGNCQRAVDTLLRLCYDQRTNLTKFRIYVDSFGCLMTILTKEYRIYACQQLSKIMLNPIVKTAKFTEIFFDEFLPDNWQPQDNQSELAELQIKLCLWHSLWSHSNLTQITNAASYFREFIRPFVETEGQFLLACHMSGPLMWPLQADKTGKLIELVVELYNSLSQIPKTSPIRHCDTIADLMYHIKYIYVGHGVLDYVKDLFANFQEELRTKLKFILPQPS